MSAVAETDLKEHSCSTEEEEERVREPEGMDDSKETVSSETTGLMHI